VGDAEGGCGVDGGVVNEEAGGCGGGKGRGEDGVENGGDVCGGRKGEMDGCLWGGVEWVSVEGLGKKWIGRRGEGGCCSEDWL